MSLLITYDDKVDGAQFPNDPNRFFLASDANHIKNQHNALANQFTFLNSSLLSGLLSGQIASQAEVITGTVTNKGITPETLLGWWENTKTSDTLLTGLAADQHTHSNKALLDSLTGSGNGSLFLDNSGNYSAPPAPGGFTPGSVIVADALGELEESVLKYSVPIANKPQISWQGTNYTAGGNHLSINVRGSNAYPIFQLLEGGTLFNASPIPNGAFNRFEPGQIRVKNISNNFAGIILNNPGQDFSENFVGAFSGVSFTSDNYLRSSLIFLASKNFNGSLTPTRKIIFGVNGSQTNGLAAQYIDFHTNAAALPQNITDATLSTRLDGNNIWSIINAINAPTSGLTDSFQLYSADITSGNAAPHFRTETGQIIRLFQSAAIADAASGTEISTINSILTVLRDRGFIAP